MARRDTCPSWPAEIRFSSPLGTCATTAAGARFMPRAARRGAWRRLPRAAGLCYGRDRLPAAATLTRTRAAARAGLVDWSGTVLWPKLLTAVLACARAAPRAGLMDWSGAVLRPGFLAIALTPLLALALVRILIAVLREGGWIERED